MYWFQRLFRKNKVERQLDSELRFHLEQMTAAYIRAGSCAGRGSAAGAH